MELLEEEEEEELPGRLEEGVVEEGEELEGLSPVEEPGVLEETELLGEEGETEDSDDPWIPASHSEEDLDETEDTEELDPPEDPATPWWASDRGEPPPQEEEGDEAMRRALDTLFGTEVRPNPTETAHDQGGEPTGEVTHTGTGGDEGPERGGAQRRTTEVETTRQN